MNRTGMDNGISTKLLRIARRLVANGRDNAIDEAVDEINKLLEDGKITASRGITASGKLMNILFALALAWGIGATGVALRNSNLNGRQIKDLEGRLQQQARSIENIEMKWDGGEGNADLGNGIDVNVSQDGGGMEMEIVNGGEVLRKIQIKIDHNLNGDEFKDAVNKAVQESLQSMFNKSAV